jgi:aspartate 1-decarboxylase
MKIEMLLSKLHRATVTGADLHYEGSISIDEELIKSANMRVGQKVEIWNINNGERFSTYIIRGTKKGEVALNGAASRKVQVGDHIIIVTYGYFDEDEVKNYKPTVVILDDNNKIKYTKNEI